MSIGNLRDAREIYLTERDALEAGWLEHPPAPEEAFAQADAHLNEWLTRTRSRPIHDLRPFWARRYWKRRNLAANLCLEDL